MRIKAHTRKVIEASIRSADLEIGRLRRDRDSAARRLDQTNRYLDALIAQRDQLQADIDYDDHFDKPMQPIPGVSPFLARSIASLFGYPGVAGDDA